MPGDDYEARGGIGDATAGEIAAAAPGMAWQLAADPSPRQTAAGLVSNKAAGVKR
jgi:hypothetical protein